MVRWSEIAAGGLLSVSGRGLVARLSRGVGAVPRALVVSFLVVAMGKAGVRGSGVG
jgi:hypothetical protein